MVPSVSKVVNMYIKRYEERDCIESAQNYLALAKSVAKHPNMYGASVCTCCGKRTHRFAYWANAVCCSTCSRRIARAILVAFTMKNFQKKMHSRGSRYGYKLAHTEHCKDTMVWLKEIVEEAKNCGVKVHMLGRDMDAFYQEFQLEDNVVYLSGWNRNFASYAYDSSKMAMIEHYDVKDGDYVIDTGFYGSILNDMVNYVSITGFLLSADTRSSWDHFRLGDDYEYREWIVEVEHIRRARTVNHDYGLLPNESYSRLENLRYEQGFFAGFRAGVRDIMR